MASVPIAPPVELTRFGVHYPLSSESHDRERGHNLPSDQYNHSSMNHSHSKSTQSPLSSTREAPSPSGRDSPPSGSQTIVPHKNSFGMESDPGLTSDTGSNSIPHSSPQIKTWPDTKPLIREVVPFGQFPYHATHLPPQYRAEITGPNSGPGPNSNGLPPSDTYPRAAPYYMPVGAMHPMDAGREGPYERHKRVEDQIRRERELAKARRHVCPVCDKRFNRPSSLNTHMSVHTGAKPYQCTREGCGRRFSVSSNLRRHERTHEARGRPANPKQHGHGQGQQTVPRTPAMYSPAQPTLFVQAPAAPPNITYPYTYPSGVSTHSHSHSGHSHSLGPSLPLQRYSYPMGGSLPSSGMYHSSLLHREVQSTPVNGAPPHSTHSAHSGHSHSGHSKPATPTPPAQTSILMPQPTKSNSSLMM